MRPVRPVRRLVVTVPGLSSPSREAKPSLRSVASPMAEWKGKWWIVDPWAGSLGHEIVYERGRGYPFGGMVEPLFLEMVYDD